MKAIILLLQVLLFVFLLAHGGCEPPKTPLATGNGAKPLVCSCYAPVEIEFMPLTEFATQGPAEPHISTYVSLLDAFGSQTKSPANFRFELYEFIPLSPNEKGDRIEKWPPDDPNDPNDSSRYWIDLSTPAANKAHWRDFIRAYEFNLPFEPEDLEYILDVTCEIPNARRLTAEFRLKRRN